ncbi:unnamed protein product, partial [Rotaria socialis]
MLTTRFIVAVLLLICCLAITQCQNDATRVLLEKMPKRGQERIRKYVSAGLAMQQRKQNDSETDWSSSSEINDTSSSASIQPSTASESKESKKHRRHRGLEKNLRDVLRYSLREGFEGISYTRPIPSDTCGRQQISPKFSERILGGFEAVAHSWPW